MRTTTAERPSSGTAAPRQWHPLRRDGAGFGAEVFGDATDRTPILVLDGIGCAGWAFGRVIPGLSRSRRVILLHYRGHGRSPPVADEADLGMDALADDAAAALDALGIHEVLAVGFSMGFQVALELARLHRDRVRGLASLAGPPGRPLDSFGGTDLGAAVLPALVRFRGRFPRAVARVWARALPSPWIHDVAMRIGVDAANIEPRDLELYLRHMAQVRPAVFLRMLAAAQDHCAEDVLPDLRVPTWVCAGGRDGFVPARRLRAMVDHIPNAWWTFLPHATHALPAEHPRRVLDGLEALAEEVDRQALHGR